MNELIPPMQTSFLGEHILSIEDELEHLKAMHPFHYEIFLLYGSAMFNSNMTTFFETFSVSEMVTSVIDINNQNQSTINPHSLRMFVDAVFSVEIMNKAKEVLGYIGHNYDLMNLSYMKPGYESVFLPLFSKTIGYVKQVIFDELYKLIHYYQLNIAVMAPILLSKRVGVSLVGYPTIFDSTPLKTRYIAIKTHVKIITVPQPAKLLGN